MMRGLLVILPLLFTLSTWAQQFQEESYYIKSTKEIKVDKREGYYENRGAFTVNFSNNLVLTGKANSVPLSLQVDFVTARNFSVGPLFTYLQYKSNYQKADNMMVITNSKVKYHQYVAGVKASYHIMPFLEEMSRKELAKHLLDVYITGWLGYSFVSGSGPQIDQAVIDENSTVRGGIGIGARSMILDRFGFFIEGGYSSYAFGTFGLTFLVSKP